MFVPMRSFENVFPMLPQLNDINITHANYFNFPNLNHLLGSDDCNPGNWGKNSNAGIYRGSEESIMPQSVTMLTPLPTLNEKLIPADTIDLQKLNIKPLFPSQYYCLICNLAFVNPELLIYHLRGDRHSNRIRALHLIIEALEKGIIRATISNKTYTTTFYCDPCQTQVNSPLQFEAHINGVKHIKKVQAIANTLNADTKVAGPQATIVAKTNVRPRVVIEQKAVGKKIQCQPCDIYVNSKKQWEQHISSKRHRLKGEALIKLPALPIQKFKPVATMNTKIISLMTKKQALENH